MSDFVFKLDGQSAITAEAFKTLNPSPEIATNTVEGKIALGQMMLSLEVAHRSFQNGEVAAKIISRLAKDLHQLRSAVTPAIWQRLIPMAQNHQIMEYLMQDPFTRWSFKKPRGYNGDATLLDIYYRHPSINYLINEATDIGRQIYEYTSNADSSIAGRERCEILTDYVDRTAERNPQAEILSIASGHLREAETSKALKAKTLKRWVAFDQDPHSVMSVTTSFDSGIVKPFEGAVRGLIRRRYDLGSFDLVYASGIYDYLTPAVGAKVMQRAMEMVKPGGTFLFANFSDEILTDGYMETFMDWPLILRNEDDIWAIINASTDRNSVDARVSYGSNRNIVYGEVTKK